MAPWWVVKVGGSLLDQSGFAARFQNWRHVQPLSRLLLIPGGGGIVDALRTLDQQQGLGDEAAHWLAIAALSLTARVLAALLPDATVISEVSAAEAIWSRRQLPILDVEPFLRRDEQHPDHLPHSWTVTSDSIAARVAHVYGASKLVLLKACPLEEGKEWDTYAAQGIVDAYFPHLARKLGDLSLIRFGPSVHEVVGKLDRTLSEPGC
jgi:aspartokinase-like uncharacterized kinase